MSRLFVTSLDLQLKHCRDSVPEGFLSNALQLEHLIIRSVIARPRKQEGFFLCLTCDVKVGEDSFLYVRGLSQGTLSGIERSMLLNMGDNTVFDLAATASEVKRFQLPSRSRAHDITNIFKRLSEMSSHSSEYHADGCAVYCNSSGTTFSKFVGEKFSGICINDLVSAHLKPHVLAPSDYLTLIQRETLSIVDQLTLINAIPSQCPLASSAIAVRKRNLTLPHAWFQLSPKTAIINDPHDIDSVLRANELLASCCPAPRKSSNAAKRCRNSVPDIKQRLLRRDRFTQMTQACDGDHLAAQLTEITTSPTTGFQQLLALNGHVRVLTSLPGQLVVLWNKYDPEKSEFTFHCCD